MSKSSKYWDYWEGRDTIVLVPQMVHADWGKDPQAVAFANLAFKVYYDARRHVGAIGDSKHQRLMIGKLEDAAREGSKVFQWGDMETVFDKMGRDGTDRNQWSDGATATYRPAATTLPVKQTIWKGHRNVNAPYAAVQFLQAMDANMVGLASIGNDFIEKWKKLEAIKRHAMDPAAQWKRVSDIFKAIKDGADKAAPFLWLAPEAIDYAGHRFSGYLGHVAQVHDMADTFFKWSGKGYAPSEAAQWTVLQKGLGMLPVLGGFYAGALDMIPGLKSWFTGVVTQRQQRLDAAMHGIK